MALHRRRVAERSLRVEEVLEQVVDPGGSRWTLSLDARRPERAACQAAADEDEDDLDLEDLEEDFDEAESGTAGTGVRRKRASPVKDAANNAARAAHLCGDDASDLGEHLGVSIFERSISKEKKINK